MIYQHLIKLNHFWQIAFSQGIVITCLAIVNFEVNYKHVLSSVWVELDRRLQLCYRYEFICVYLHFIKLKKHWCKDSRKTFYFVMIHPWLDVISGIFVLPSGNIDIYCKMQPFIMMDDTVYLLSVELHGLEWCLWAPPQLAMFPAWLIY